MSAWTDARDNVKHGLLAIWFSASPMVQGWMIGFAMGAFVVWVL